MLGYRTGEQRAYLRVFALSLAEVDYELEPLVLDHVVIKLEDVERLVDGRVCLGQHSVRRLSFACLATRSPLSAAG